MPLASNNNTAQTDDAENTVRDDVLGFFRDLGDAQDQCVLQLRRIIPGSGGRTAFVGNVTPETTEGDVKKAWGGGKYKIQARAAQNFDGNGKRYKAGHIVNQHTFELEGEPITRRASDIEAALRETDAPGGQSGMPAYPMQGTGPNQGTPIGGNLDAGSILAMSMNMMTTTMMGMMEAGREDAKSSRDMLIAMMGKQEKQVDPFEQIGKIMDLQARIGGGDGSQAWVAALPALEPLVDKVLSKVGEISRSRPALPPGAQGGPPRSANGHQQPTRPQQQPEPSREQPTQAEGRPMPTPEQRLGSALNIIALAATDPECDPASVASTVASIVGSDYAQAVADEPSAVDQIIMGYPHMADYRVMLQRVHEALGELYEDDGDESNDDDDQANQPTRSDADPSEGVRPSGEDAA